jgi:hypothetical protein
VTTRARARWAILATALALLGAGRAGAYEEVPVTDGGVLTGVVRFAGTAPRLEPLPVNKNRDVCGEVKPSEALVVGPDRGVRGAVVLIEGITRGKKGNGEVVLDNTGCVFVAHVTALMAGDRTRVKNSDPILHNTHGFRDRATVFNLALPNRNQMVEITKRLTRPGVIRVLCDAHPHMSAWIIVHDSPYHAVTDERGTYRIDGVPPGTYRVSMWHQGFRVRGTDKDGRPVHDEPRALTRKVTIPREGTVAADFEFR